MCISAATMIAVSSGLSVAGSIAGAAASSAAAQSEAAFRDYQLKMQDRQLKDEQEMIRLRAQQAEADRLEQARRIRAANEAFVAGSGGDNISFLQGAEKANEAAMRRDIASLRLNSESQVSRITDQIAVNAAESRFAFGKARMTSQAAWTSGIFNAASSAARGYAQYDYYKKP